MNELRLSAAAVLLAVAVVPAAENKKVENPEFVAWAKYKEGTAVTYKLTTTAGRIDMVSTDTHKLVEIGKDKVVIETDSTTTLMGKERKGPTEKKGVTKDVEANKLKGFDAKTGTPDGTTDEGKETLKIGGTEYKTKCYKFKQKQEGVDVEGQIWLSDDMPGKLVKVIRKQDYFGTTMEATQEVTDVSIKK